MTLQTKFQPAILVRLANRKNFSVKFPHPSRARSVGRFVVRSLGTSDEVEARDLVRQLNGLLAAPYLAFAAPEVEFPLSPRAKEIFLETSDEVSSVDPEWEGGDLRHEYHADGRHRLVFYHDPVEEETQAEMIFSANWALPSVPVRLGPFLAVTKWGEGTPYPAEVFRISLSKVPPLRVPDPQIQVEPSAQEKAKRFRQWMRDRHFTIANLEDLIDLSAHQWPSAVLIDAFPGRVQLSLDEKDSLIQFMRDF